MSSLGSMPMHEKISIAEAVQWIQNVKESWEEGGFPEDHEELCKVCADLKPVDFKAPRKPRVSKGSSSLSERCDAEYDTGKCDASVWLKGSASVEGGGCGHRVQCSSKKVDGTFLCKRHSYTPAKSSRCSGYNRNFRHCYLSDVFVV